MENKSKKLVIFDFDGVLVNTLEMSYSIHRENNESFTKERFMKLHDGNFHENYRSLVDKEGHVETLNFYEKYQNKLMTYSIESILHDAVIHLSSSFILTIVSATDENVISDFIKKEKLDGCFSDILGHRFHVSKVVKIKKLLEKYNLEPNDAVFITDTIGDIQEGNICKVYSIGVTWGVNDKETLSMENPVAIIDNPINLVPAIKKILN